MSFPDYVKRSSGYRYPNGLIGVPESECYSSLAVYGNNGAVSGIKAPTPVTSVPMIFNKLGQGHKIPKNPGRAPLPKKWTPYITINQTCQKPQYNQMYSNRRNL
jgi:hypothetical protein